MNRSLLLVLTAAICSAPVLAADGSAPAGQVDRGRQLFQKSGKAQVCSSCHSLEGVGNAVGPDLKVLGSVVGPRGLATTILMSNTCYVQEYTLVNGTVFVGMEKKKDAGVLEVWDVSQFPAVLRTLKAGDVKSMRPNTTWKHPPSTSAYNAEELADIIAYVKFVATGTPKEVSADELQ